MGNLKIKKLGSIKKAKASVNKSSGNSDYTKSIPAEGITVRFLEEPDQWYEIQQYWDEGDERMYIVTEETPQHFVKDSYVRYVCNVVDTNESEVIALAMPKTVAKSMMERYEKHSTILDRDYELSKSGSGLKTKYLVTPEAPSKKNLSRYELKDIMEILEGMVPGDEDADLDDDDDEDERPSRRKKSSASRRKKSDDYEDDDDDDIDDDDDDEDEDDEPPVRKRRSSSRRSSRVVEDDDDDADDEDDEPAPKRRVRKRR